MVAELLAQKPEQNTTNTGRVRIRDAAGKEREIPVRFEITATPTNWASVYETVASEGGPGGQGLRNMRERAAAIGGALSLRSAPGSGTSVEVVLRA